MNSPGQKLYRLKNSAQSFWSIFSLLPWFRYWDHAGRKKIPGLPFFQHPCFSFWMQVTPSTSVGKWFRRCSFLLVRPRPGTKLEKGRRPTHSAKLVSLPGRNFPQESGAVWHSGTGGPSISPKWRRWMNYLFLVIWAWPRANPAQVDTMGGQKLVGAMETCSSLNLMVTAVSSRYCFPSPSAVASVIWVGNT